MCSETKEKRKVVAVERLIEAETFQTHKLSKIPVRLP